tara:strand:- start:64158 stop:64364 length:207 start_codon:yes stop_codon:yes gene_type:complete
MEKEHIDNIEVEYQEETGAVEVVISYILNDETHFVRFFDKSSHFIEGYAEALSGTIGYEQVIITCNIT